VLLGLALTPPAIAAKAVSGSLAPAGAGWAVAGAMVGRGELGYAMVRVACSSWLVARGLWLVACCLLIVACCLLLVACCLLLVACGLLLVACCLLLVDYCLLLVAC
jgi:hypothetical protein